LSLSVDSGDKIQVLSKINQSVYTNHTTGAVKLWSNAEGAKFSLELQGNGTYAIRSLKFNQYVWLSKESPYITRAGNRNTSSGQWFIAVLPI
jgi:hypothetical protein